MDEIIRVLNDLESDLDRGTIDRNDVTSGISQARDLVEELQNQHESEIESLEEQHAQVVSDLESDKDDLKMDISRLEEELNNCE